MQGSFYHMTFKSLVAQNIKILHFLMIKLGYDVVTDAIVKCLHCIQVTDSQKFFTI